MHDQKSPAETADRPRVLLVDDHEIGRISMARLLEAMGFDVTSACDGTSALAQLESSPHFDFVLTDLRLPDFDGREVVLAAQRIEPAPRIALITGWDVDAEEQGRLGVEWVFLKPVDVFAMVAKMRCA